MDKGNWAGAVVVAIGGGPSLSLEQIRTCWRMRSKVKTIAINDAIRLAPWADMLYFCDKQWFKWHRDRVLKFAKSGRLVVTLENQDLQKQIPGLVCMKNDGERGFSQDPGSLRNGRNSGYQVLHLAAHLRAKKVILLGYDMKKCETGKTHWFGDHPVGGAPGRFDSYRKLFGDLVVPLANLGVEVVNATPESGLDVFPMVGIEEALATA